MSAKTKLFERHVALDGRMVEFAGWLLPVQYAPGPKAEHLRVREAAGLFDIDHMGQVVISGPDATHFLQSIMTADVSALSVGQAGYSLMCYQDGTIVDDTFIYRLPERFFVAINAGNNRKDTAWMRYHAQGWDVAIKNVSQETYMLALQGPLAQRILDPLCDHDLDALAFHRAVETKVAGLPALVGRTGYTGEDGFELFFPAADAVQMWDAIVSSGAPQGLLPIGLAARDSLRFEPCLPLYGQEISSETLPLEAGLGWAVALDKDGFCGREALLKSRLEGPRRKLVGLEMVERAVPRHGYPVLIDGQRRGEVTTGMYAPSLGRFLALAYLPAVQAEIGATVAVEVRGQAREARIVDKPFYTPAYRR